MSALRAKGLTVKRCATIGAAIHIVPFVVLAAIVTLGSAAGSLTDRNSPRYTDAAACCAGNQDWHIGNQGCRIAAEFGKVTVVCKCQRDDSKEEYRRKQQNHEPQMGCLFAGTRSFQLLPHVARDKSVDTATEQVGEKNWNRIDRIACFIREIVGRNMKQAEQRMAADKRQDLLKWCRNRNVNKIDYNWTFRNSTRKTKQKKYKDGIQHHSFSVFFLRNGSRCEKNVCNCRGIKRMRKFMPTLSNVQRQNTTTARQSCSVWSQTCSI